MYSEQIFGEEDLVYNQKRQYTIICDSEEAEMYRIPYKLFHRKIYSIKEVKERINQGIKQKLTNFNDRVEQLKLSVSQYSSFMISDRKSPSNLDKISQTNDVKIIKETNILS